MKIQSQIVNTNSQYRVQIGTFGFTALEDEKLIEFGEPLVDIGSVITGAVSRPGENATTVSFTPTNGGTGATGTVTVSPEGVITSVTITAGGSGYVGVPTIAFAGDGSGATGIAAITGDAVTGVSMTAGGTGYSSVPYTVTFSLPPAPRRMRSDFPIVQIFDLNDFVDADVRAQVYANVIVSRLTAAKSSLVSLQSNFEGETVITV